MKHKNNHEGGFTLTETMAAVGIISIAFSVLGAAAVFSFRQINGPVDFLSFGIRLLRADTLVRRGVEAVTIPYWELDFESTARDQRSLVIPWYEGRKEDRLMIYFSRNGELAMETESQGKKDRQVLINNLEDAAIAVWRDEAQVPRGIDIMYRYHDRTCHTRSNFGSSPLRRSAP
jgi:prepilin-type N-terminal cleavage/methylation domain-containing protein